MERRNLICLLVGWHSAKNQNLEAGDVKILIDNELMDAKFTPLGTESGDVELLQELLAETMMYVIGKGYNRKDRRKKGVVKSK